MDKIKRIQKMLVMKPQSNINTFKAELNDDRRLFEKLEGAAKEYGLDITKDDLARQFIIKFGRNDHGYTPAKELEMKELDGAYADIQRLRKDIKFYDIMLDPKKEQLHLERNVYLYLTHVEAIAKATEIYAIRDRLLNMGISSGLIHDLFHHLGMISSLEINPYDFLHYHGWDKIQKAS